jgi:spermidine synthase
LLQHPVRTITVVDIDRRVTTLARRHPALLALNRGALDDPRVRVVHDDAVRFLERSRDHWDVILGDLPDPSTLALARLYALETCRAIAARLRPGGVFATQATSPVTPEASDCIAETVAAAGFSVRRWTAPVPSFGDSAFVLGTAGAPQASPSHAVSTRAQPLVLDAYRMRTTI